MQRKRQKPKVVKIVKVNTDVNDSNAPSLRLSPSPIISWTIRCPPMYCCMVAANCACRGR